MHRTFARAVFALTLVLVTSRVLPAQDAVLTEFYGSGVHQYFGGNLGQAYADLTTAINGGTKDPRAYYFRALVDMRMGDQGRADADMRAGAALESADVNQFYPVGKSLERVQGPMRLALERYRVVARAEAHERQLKRDAARYEEHKRAETKVLRDPKFVQPPKPPVPAPGVDEDNLFGEDEAAPKPGDKPADEGLEEMPSDDETPPPAEEPAEDAEMPADEPAPPRADESGEGDPFGDEKEGDAAPK